MPSLAANGLKLAVVRKHSSDSALVRAIGWNFKGKLSPVLYLAGILFSFVDVRVACAIYVFIALLWFIPDRRMERMIRQGNHRR
jgi:hypothetical protein